MKFFRKLFGSSASDPTPQLDAESKGAPIRAFDKFGRPIEIPRSEWLGILRDSLRSSWDQPDALANHITQALHDGLFHSVEKAAVQLSRIDTQPERGVVLLAVIYLQTNRGKEAEKALANHIQSHGESGVVLTNLAKAQEALGRTGEARSTLWRALELDPNQDNGLVWYESIQRESEGEEGGLSALHRVAELPGSWRAPIWLARNDLKEKRLESALERYHQSLGRMPEPIPTEILMQISGDLGNSGHLMEMLELVAPRLDLEIHGIAVGNNLIKGYLDTGQLELARGLLDQLQAQQRPDWRENLGFWEAELQKARINVEDALSEAPLQMVLLNLKGALWLPDGHSLERRFPQKTEASPHIVVSGSSVESPNLGAETKITPTDHSGRYSRALPLYFAEHLSLHSAGRTTTAIPWILNGSGGFMLAGAPSGDAEVVEMARKTVEQEGESPDYALNSHLIVRGENYTLQLRLYRCIDGRLLGTLRRDFPEAAFHQVVESVLTELNGIMTEEADLPLESNRTELVGEAFEHYLFRLEQALAVLGSSLAEKNATFLSNPAEILDGMLHLCLQNPSHLPSRMLLLRALRKLQSHQGPLVQSMKRKVEALMAEHPMESEIQGLLDTEMQEVYAA